MSNTRLIFGFHAITSRLRQNPASVKEIFLDSGRRDQRARDLAKLAETQDVRLIPCDDARLAGMAGDARHQGVAACIDASRSYIDIEDVLDTLVEPALLLVLDGIQDPHNLGACLRVADAFGVHAVRRAERSRCRAHRYCSQGREWRSRCGAIYFRYQSGPYLAGIETARRIDTWSRRRCG